MKVAYIIGPYRAKTIRGVVENIRRAEAAALKYWKKGYAVICPHMNSALFDGAIPDEDILTGDIEIMKRCDTVVVLPGWDDSAGSIDEQKIAEEMIRPVEIIYEEAAELEDVA